MKRFSFTTEMNFSHVILLSLSCEMSPDFTQLDRGPHELGHRTNLATYNGEGKLLIKFGGSQDVKTATSY